jgi:hypothetical protein
MAAPLSNPHGATLKSREVLREDARAVIETYATGGGLIHNRQDEQQGNRVLVCGAQKQRPTAIAEQCYS